MVSVAFRLLPENGTVAVMVATTDDAVSLVAMVNVCDDSPAGIVVRAGTIAAGLLLASVTSRSPSGAGAESVTVPATDDPPIVDVADSDRL